MSINKNSRLKRIGFPFLGILLGAAAGWLYWYYVGCSAGSCAITSKPLPSIAYGALMGLTLFFPTSKT